MSIRTIAICASQVPFRSGGAEIHVSSLQQQLIRRGYRAEIIQLPFKWYPRVQVLKSCLTWRLLDLTESDGEAIDLVIATKFPSYVVRHPRKVTWLIHQFRQVYDQLGTSLSDFSSTPEDVAFRNAIIRMDNRVLRESNKIFTNARNTAARLARYNGISAEALYHPPKLDGLYHNADYGDYVFTVSRLDRAKRIDLLIRAMAVVRSGARLIIAGTGPEHGTLVRLIEDLEIEDRVKLVGYVSDDELLRLYAGCCAVAYVPFDEDYGYVTLEAFASGKPVITTYDSGGVLEFVDNGVTGYVTDGEPANLAARIDELWLNRDRAVDLGKSGQDRIKDITWDHAIDRLLEE